MEEQLPNRSGISGQRARGDRLRPRMPQHDPCQQMLPSSIPGMPNKTATRLPLVCSSTPAFNSMMVKTNKHHDRAGINDDLHGGDELRAQQQIFARQRGHHRDQRQRAVDGMGLRQQVDRSRHADRPEGQKQN